MRKELDTLVLLTATYPFGRVSETFLEAELPILARRFRRVMVLPSKREPLERRLPEGVRCVTLLADGGSCGLLGELARCPVLMLRQVADALTREGSAKPYLRHVRTYLDIGAQNVRKYRLLASFIADEGLKEALFYDYWLENSTLALAWLRRKGTVRRAVARAHNFDLYDERWPTGSVPFRATKVRSLDRVFAISQHGLDYLARKMPSMAGKLALSRLGVVAPQSVLPENASRRPERPVIVSCARLEGFKRVHLVPQVLARVAGPLHWVHFGDGPTRAGVEHAARKMGTGVTWEMRGHVDRQELLRFYEKQRVDAFISLSAIEGLPVSIMEAISYGIPVVATDVSGVPEIVNHHTGRLVPADAPPDRIADAVRFILSDQGPSRGEIFAFYRAHFCAERNFSAFADMLHAV